MVEIKIHDRTFKSQAAAREHVRSVLGDIKATRDLRLTHPEHFDFIESLLHRHPRADSKLKDVVRLEVREALCSRPSKRMYEVMLHYIDGRKDNCSALYKCISGKDLSDNAKLAQAMRQAIEYQIKEFRATTDQNACVVCGVSCKDAMLHVDHVIEFQELKAMFLKCQEHAPPDSFADDIDSILQKKFLPCDADFENAWKAYHKENADLQLACEKCNLGVLRSSRATTPLCEKVVKNTLRPRPMFR